MLVGVGCEGGDEGDFDVSSCAHANLICKLFLMIKINKVIHTCC